MSQNNNFSVLPFYTDVKYQSINKPNAYGRVYPLYCPKGYILPFQIVTSTSLETITSVKLYDKNGGSYQDITSAISGTGFQILRFSALGYDVITYSGIMPITFSFSEGMYYLKIETQSKAFYSDIFNIVDGGNPIKIQWWDDQDLFIDGGGRIVYSNGFKNTLFVSANIGMPDYTFEEEGESRDGYFFSEKQISEKVYKFNMFAPEYLCDAMRLIRLSDNVRITGDDGTVYNADQFLITPKWQEQGFYATVECEFHTNTVVKKNNKATIYQVAGDFNDDYNDDYLNNQ